MKNRYFLLLLAALMSCAKEPVRTKPNPALQMNWKTLGILGKPEQILEVNYKQHVPDSLLEDFVTREDFSFDDDGNLIAGETRAEKELVQKSESYEFDLDGNLLKVISADAGHNVTNTKENILDSLGRVKEIRNYNRKGDLVYKVSYKLDEHGNAIEWQQTEPMIPIVYKRKYTYDGQGRCVEREDITGGKFQVRDVISYDSVSTIKTTQYIDGQLDNVMIQSFDQNKRLIDERIEYRTRDQHRQIRYDDKGNIVEQIYLRNNAIDSVYSYRIQYSYDDQGNWIKRVKSNLDGKPRTEVERRIAY